MAKRDESKILFPEAEWNGFTIKPYTFGQTAKALRLLTPCLAALPDSSMSEIESINLTVLAYTLTENDCESVFELISMATDCPIDELQSLDTETGLELLRQVWQVSIQPILLSMKKKFRPDKTEDGLTSSSSSPELDSPEATSTE